MRRLAYRHGARFHQRIEIVGGAFLTTPRMPLPKRRPERCLILAGSLPLSTSRSMVAFAFVRRDVIVTISPCGLTRLRSSTGSRPFTPSREYTETMHYELWETLSRNMLADFGTESEALAEVRELLEINPPEMVDELVLVWRDGDRGGTLAAGAELAARARIGGSGLGSISR